MFVYVEEREVFLLLMKEKCLECRAGENESEVVRNAQVSPQATRKQVAGRLSRKGEREQLWWHSMSGVPCRHWEVRERSLVEPHWTRAERGQAGVVRDHSGAQGGWHWASEVPQPSFMPFTC